MAALKHAPALEAFCDGAVMFAVAVAVGEIEIGHDRDEVGVLAIGLVFDDFPERFGHECEPREFVLEQRDLGLGVEGGLLALGELPSREAAPPGRRSRENRALA